MVHTFILTVVTDDTNTDAPDSQAIQNEIVNNLEFDHYTTSGILRVLIAPKIGYQPSNYRGAVERSLEQ